MTSPAIPEWATPALIDRFWRKVDRRDLFGCWIWTGAYSVKPKPSQPPRPVFWVGRLRAGERVAHDAPQWIVPAFRMALALTDGVPLWEREGLEACHRPGVCTTPACVNPAHGYWGTPLENRMDRYPSLRERVGDLCE